MTSADILETKKCIKCNEIKIITEYHKKSDSKDGLSSYCKLCKKQLDKKYQITHLDKFKINSAKWRKLNSTKNKSIKKKWKDKNPDYDKKYRNTHKDKCHKTNKEYRLKNVDKILEYNKEYYINNKLDLLQKSKIYQKNRRSFDALFKMQGNMRSGLRRFLKRDKILKSHEYFCCTQEQLWNHLEKQFRDGMTRDNYGSIWHVDHIIPLQWFKDNDLMDETNKKIACHYGNLQPLFVLENISKSDKVPETTNFKY